MIDHANSSEDTAVDLDRAAVLADRERRVYLARLRVWAQRLRALAA